MEQGILATRFGMSAGGVEQKVTVLEIAQKLLKTIKGKATDPRHVELQEEEVGTGEHTKPQTQVQRQPHSTQWLTGRRSSIEGARRDRKAWEWQTLWCQ